MDLNINTYPLIPPNTPQIPNHETTKTRKRRNTPSLAVFPSSQGPQQQATLPQRGAHCSPLYPQPPPTGDVHVSKECTETPQPTEMATTPRVSDPTEDPPPRREPGDQGQIPEAALSLNANNINTKHIYQKDKCFAIHRCSTAMIRAGPEGPPAGQGGVVGGPPLEYFGGPRGGQSLNKCQNSH